MSFIYFAHAAFSRQTVANQGQDEPIRTSSCPHVHCMSYGQWPNGTHGPKTPRTCRSAEPRTHTGGASRRAAGHRAGAGNRERYGRACRAFRRRVAVVRLAAERPRCSVARVDRRLGGGGGACECACSTGARRIFPAVAHRKGGRDPVHQHDPHQPLGRSEEHTSELQSLMRISYAVFCLKNKNNKLSIHFKYPI